MMDRIKAFLGTNTVPLNVEKLILGFLIIGGYIAITAGLFFIPVPIANAQLIAQALATLGPLVGVIVYSAWPKGSETDKEAIKNLTEKVNPVTVPAENLTSVQVNEIKKDGQG